MDSSDSGHKNGENTLLDAAFLRKLERLAISARKAKIGGAKGERLSKRKGVSVEFADYRPYVQGDDMRHVDWNIYGRLEGLYLKLFQEQEDLTVHLLLDASASMGFGNPQKFDFARQLAAAIGYIALVGYDRVMLEAFSNARQETLEPMRGKAHVRKFFAHLESMRAEGATDLFRACRNYRIRTRAKGVVVVVSDFMDEDGYEEALKQLQSGSNEIYVVQVLAPEEIEPHLAGDLKLVDSETSAFAEISVNRALLKRYKQNRDAFIEGLRRFCYGRGISHFIVSSDTPIEALTLDMLRKGGLLR